MCDIHDPCSDKLLMYVRRHRRRRRHLCGPNGVDDKDDDEFRLGYSGSDNLIGKEAIFASFAH